MTEATPSEKPALAETRNEQFRIESVRVRHIADNDPDASYLEQEGFEERLAEYNEGRFGFIGIVAEAEVSYMSGPQTRRIARFASGGLWGIEDDSSPEYIAEIEGQQIADLAEHLSHFGVEVTADELEAAK